MKCSVVLEVKLILQEEVERKCDEPAECCDCELCNISTQ